MKCDNEKYMKIGNMNTQHTVTPKFTLESTDTTFHYHMLLL